LGLSLPLTKTGKLSQAGDDLEEYRVAYPFVNAFLSYKEQKKFKDFVVNLDKPRIHTRFNTLLNTGRTSSSKPNIQNLPRESGIRACFTPTQGYCFLQIDYSQLELRTLAQCLLDRYGKSKMAELINSGVDLHSWFGSQIVGRPAEKKDRQCAKACNFGFPGGLGKKTFAAYARKSYNVYLSEERAGELKELWLDAFPEMRLYMADSLERRLDCCPPWEGCSSGIAAGMFKRIIAGELKKDGTPYAPKMKRWAFETALPLIAPHLAGEVDGSYKLLKKALAETIVTSTGRIRSNCSYCQARNTPFQAMAADGCKIALYELIRAGYRVVNFIHDEFIIEILLEADLEAVGAHVKKIIVDAMKIVVPDVNIDAEFVFTDRWHKDAELVRDEQGKVRLYTDKDQQEKDAKKAAPKAARAAAGSAMDVGVGA